MTVREMSAKEVWQNFGDLGQRGFLACEGAAVHGFCGFNSDEEGLFIHSMFCSEGNEAYAALCQALKTLCKELGLRKARFTVNTNNPSCLHFVGSNRANVQSYVIEFPIEDK